MVHGLEQKSIPLHSSAKTRKRCLCPASPQHSTVPPRSSSSRTQGTEVRQCHHKDQHMKGAETTPHRTPSSSSELSCSAQHCSIQIINCTSQGYGAGMALIRIPCT